MKFFHAHAANAMKKFYSGLLAEHNQEHNGKVYSEIVVCYDSVGILDCYDTNLESIHKGGGVKCFCVFIIEKEMFRSVQGL